MENATKALMIAAAVIVAILIISLGIGIFNMASEQVDNAGDLSEYKIKLHNDKFAKYEGDNVSGADVNALLTTVFNHNIAQPDNNTCIKLVSYVGASIPKENTLSTKPSKVSLGIRYKVIYKYDQKTKLLNFISIGPAAI